MIDLDHLDTLTDAEARDLLAAVYAEVQRRDTLAQAPAQAEALAATYAAAIGRKDGDSYQPVTGAHDAYPPGSIVEGNAGEYHRATAWASHAPGTTGAPWERVWANGNGWTTTPPAAAGPLAWAVGISAVGPADPGGKPQTVVSHKGRLWRCKVTHVTHAGWVPSAATHAVWTDIGPA